MKKFKRSAPPPAKRPPARPAPRGPQTPRGRAVAGVHAVRELLAVRPRAVAELWLKDGADAHADLNAIAAEATRARVRVTRVSVATLDRVVAVHQGVVAFATEDPELSFGALAARDVATLIVLDGVEDPHNLGAVVRTAWLFGADGILTPGTRAAPLSPTVCKVARGGAEHVPVMRDTGLVESIKQLKERGFWTFGLSANGTKTLYDLEIPEKVIWVLGSEAAGLRKPVERACDELVSIPQVDPRASFNVSVAAALALGETFRQRRG